MASLTPLGPRNRRARGLTRERLLQAADRLWSERGVRGAALEDIARDAAVTKPTLYYYFADKSGLFTEMVCSVLEQHGAGLRTASRAASSARDRLVAATAYLIRAQCSAPRLLREGGIKLTTDQQSQTRSAFAAQAVLNLVDPWIGRDARPGGRTADKLAADIVDLVVDGIGV